MRQRRNGKKVFAIFLALLSLTLGSCTKSNPYAGDEKYQIYLKATAAGFTGTYEEWLTSIKGDQGPKGDTGDKGDKGDTGAQGPKGDTGAKGDQGETGEQGPKGDKGDTGAKGDTGDVGAKGDQGDKGDTGSDGNTPYIGDNGNWWIGYVDTNVPATGAKGETGEQGSKGDTGDKGKSAYEMYCDAYGYVGTEEEWLADLANGTLQTKLSYVVKFDSNGGPAIADQSVWFGEKIIEPDIEREDYFFEGWYVANDKWNFATNYVFENITLTAKWRTKLINVSFNTNGGVDFITNRQYLYGSEVTLPMLSGRFYYGGDGQYTAHFAGWTYNGEFVRDGVWEIDHDVTLVAAWSLVDPTRIGIALTMQIASEFRYHVVYQDDEEFDEVLSSINMILSEGLDEDPYYEGFNMYLYYDGELLTSLDWWDETYSIQINAVYVPKTFTINLDPKSGSLADGTANKVQVKFGNYFRLPVPVHPSDCEFLYWATNDGPITDEKGYSIERYYDKEDINAFAVFDEPVYIKTVDDLQQMNNAPMLSYYLENDLDLSGVNWKPINEFTGYFDGQGHVISGLTIDYLLDNYAWEYRPHFGFFRDMNGAIIKDITFEDVKFVFNSNESFFAGHYLRIGGIAGWAYNSQINDVNLYGEFLINVDIYDYSDSSVLGGLVGEASNLAINNSSTIVSTNSRNFIFGGLVGIGSGYENHLAIHNSSSFANIEQNSKPTGGLVGKTDCDTSISNSFNGGDLSVQSSNYGDSVIGGLVGLANDEITIVDSYNSGNLSGLEYDTSVGGLVGNAGKLVIERSYNEGEITTSGGTAGGLVAYVEDARIVESVNEGKVTNDYGYVTGGLVGRAMSAVIIESHNTGEISGYTVGGLVGLYGYYLEIEGSSNSGIITGVIAGGLIGAGDNNNYGEDTHILITESYNTGVVTGIYHVGGLIGNAVAHVIVENSYNEGLITGYDEVIGGLVGYSDISLTITNSYNSAKIIGNIDVGGLVGVSYANSILIENSYNSGDVSGEGGVGGIIGYVYNELSLNNCYNLGVVEGNEYVGGLVGVVDEIMIQNCYNAGEITATESKVGGLIGYASSATLSDSINFGIVTGNEIGGSIIGEIEENIDVYNLYYTSEALISDETPLIVGELVDGQSLDESFFVDILGWDAAVWDFTDVEVENGVLPKLR